MLNLIRRAMLTTLRHTFYSKNANRLSMKEIMKGTFIAWVFFIIAGCDKTNIKPITQLKIRLTDAPINAQEVNVNIKTVRVKLSDDTAWITLRPNSGVYNLLEYKNGKDTLIAEGVVPATKFINELQLILGDSNTIKIDNNPYALNLADASGNIKILAYSKMNKNIETITLDFNAALSVTEFAKGSYQLKPVVSIKN